jgi:predicted transcriptional regulator
MDSQITLRLPRALDRALAREARARGLKKSHVVREAVVQYLARSATPTAEEIYERTKHYIGSLELDREAVMKDLIARQIYEHNWRD